MSSVPMDENVKMNDSLTNSLLQVNNLLYKMSPALGIAARRNHRIDFAQQAQYAPSETIVYDCQTGSDFVGGKNSYLKLKVSKIGAGTAELGSGSICNIINRVVVRSRTGKELTRVENFNLLCKDIQVWDCPKEWKETAGAAQGYDTDSPSANNIVPTNGKVFIIPMWVIPCFNQERLLPPQLMSGCRIEITLENVATAFRSDGVVDSYVVDRPEIHWDTYDLADAYKRKIAEMASRQGLNLLHKEYFHTIVSGSATETDFNFDIKKACSKALKAMIHTRSTDQVSSLGFDSVGTLRYDYSQYQSRIGADYFPNAPISVDDTSINGNAESYYHSLFVWNKTANCWNPSSVTPLEYTSTNAAANTAPAEYENSLVAFNYNKSHVSDLQGYIVSNSRSILIDLKATPLAGAFPTGTETPRRLDVYLQYLRAVKVYVSNVEVKD